MEEMKSVLKTLQRESCRTRELTENETNMFSNLVHPQRYYPAMDVFPTSEDDRPLQELPSMYYIHEWKSQEHQPKYYQAIRRSTRLNPPIEEPCRVFAKTIHLVNPIDYMKEYCIHPIHPLLPHADPAWKATVSKLHSRNNQAYVDALANFVLSRFREKNLTPHCILYYGAYTGIAKKYTYNISGEYDTYRNCKWFWKGIKKHQARITLCHANEDIKDNTRYHEFYKEITDCPFTDEELNELFEINDVEQIELSEKTSIPLNDNSMDLLVEVNEIDDLPETVPSKQIEDEHFIVTDDIEDSSSNIIPSSNLLDVSSESSEESEHESLCLDIDVCLEIPDIPVITILQEAQEGVMDDLVMEEEIDGCEYGSDAWEARWIAWLFQVIATLTLLQSSIQFTHNDLHSNNILWRSTTQRFLYYRTKSGTFWRVPTFGKIFSIIDFGRSIFRLGSHQWISDDHWPDQDAGDQYNFGPFYNSSKPKVLPNPSFDLCRLAVSLIDGLFEEYPEKKKGKKVPILSQEGEWIIYETRSPLFNMLWSWTVDDAGHTIYETEEGEEKYDGFDLYIRIAQDVHHAVPKDQLNRSIFNPFIWKGKIPKSEIIYPIGI